MTPLTDDIYYADKEILDLLKSDFEHVDDKGWHELYQQKSDKSYWRLDKWDKYQQQFFVRLDSTENWTEFNDTQLRIELLLRTRGVSDEKCVWKNCQKLALNGLAYCEVHAYEFGTRK